jgi:serine/threonine protein kinase
MDSVKLGKGAYGSVSLISQTEVRTKDGLTFEKSKKRAVKVGRISDNELAVLQAGIKNIPKYVSHSTSDSETMVTMQVAKKANIKKSDLLKVAEGVARAIVDLNTKFKSDGKLRGDERMIHHDIKPENIGMTKGGKIKLLDWGSAKIVSKDSMTNPLSGATSLYLPPEACTGASATEKNDSWALGATLFKYATGRALLARKNEFSFSFALGMLQSEEVLKSTLGEDCLAGAAAVARESAKKEFQANLMEIACDPEIDDKTSMLIIRLLDINPEARLSLEGALEMIDKFNTPVTPVKNTSPAPRAESGHTLSSVSISSASNETEPNEVEEDLDYTPVNFNLDDSIELSEVKTAEDCGYGELSND